MDTASTLVLGTTNAGKLRELAELLEPLGISCRSLAGLADAVDVEETGSSFAENAALKASQQARALRSWVLAEDSGLCVDALGGAPGVESAYYAGPTGDGAANLRKLVAVMAEIPPAKRGAYFVCVLLVVGPDRAEAVFEGRCEGVLGDAPRGGTGFGYDPLFVPHGHDRSFAELGEGVKNELSHRGRAWTQLAGWLGVRCGGAVT